MNNEHQNQEDHIDIAEQQATENARMHEEQPILSKAEDFLGDYNTKTITLSTGKTLEIESFLPDAILINLHSPILKQFVMEPDELENEDRVAYTASTAEVITTEIRNLICRHVVSIPISMNSQAFCPQGSVSIDRFTPAEIREIFREMVSLSTKDAIHFRATQENNPNE